MKKREMLKKLTNYLHKKDYYVTTNKVQCEYLVELILNKAEKLGMLPPKTELDDKMDKEAYVLGGNSDFTTADELRWEDEDE